MCDSMGPAPKNAAVPSETQVQFPRCIFFLFFFFGVWMTGSEEEFWPQFPSYKRRSPARFGWWRHRPQPRQLSRTALSFPLVWFFTQNALGLVLVCPGLSLSWSWHPCRVVKVKGDLRVQGSSLCLGTALCKTQVPVVYSNRSEHRYLCLPVVCGFTVF